MTSPNPQPLFTRRDIVRIAGLFAAALVAAWAAAQGVESICKALEIDPDIPSRWPVSVSRKMTPGVQTPWYEWLVAAGVLAGFVVLARLLIRRSTPGPMPVLMAGLVLIVGTNLIHGPWHGLVKPHDGPLQYYEDTKDLDAPGPFLRQYVARQRAALDDAETDMPPLSCHSQTHPPGAVLLICALDRLLGGPVGVSLAMAALATLLSGGFLYGLLRDDVSPETARYVTFLFLLVPSVQVYFCASLDGVIAGAMLGSLYFFRRSRTVPAVLGSAACVVAASALTFAACFLGPVLLGIQWITQRRVGRAMAVFALSGVAWLLVDLSTGYNYLESFRIASTLENPDGFRLLVKPVSYVMTRLENVAEIILFLGPFLLVLCWRGLREQVGKMRETSARPFLAVATLAAVATLLAMFVTGAMHTGETARACLFLYPYLMLPVASYLDCRPFSARDAETLAWLVFGQALLMQTLLGFVW